MAKKKTYYSWRTKTHYDTKEARDTAHKEDKKSGKTKGKPFKTIGRWLTSGKGRREMEKSESPQVVEEDVYKEGQSDYMKEWEKSGKNKESYEKTKKEKGESYIPQSTSSFSKKKQRAKLKTASSDVFTYNKGDFVKYKKDSKSAQSFRTHYAKAKKAGKKEFSWQGRRYSTR